MAKLTRIVEAELTAERTMAVESDGKCSDSNEVTEI